MIGKEINLLFAEDDLVNYMYLQEIISSDKNFKVKGFYNGKELIDEFKKNKKYDIVILDIQMPIMNGIDCMKQIKNLSPKTPVIAVTAFAMSNDKEKYLNMGFDDYISKPINIDIFFSMINEKMNKN